MMNTIFGGVNPLVLLAACALGMILLYLGRAQVHLAVRRASRVLASALRLASRAVALAEGRLQIRNREVLLAEGASHVEKELEREFQRVEAVVQRDLQNYPTLHRQMSDLLTSLDEDYQQSASSPPSPPGWVEAVKAVAKLPDKQNSLADTILAEIKQMAEKQHNTAMTAYRKQCQGRHKRLERMMPFWRRLQKTLSDVEGNITGLQQRAATIDARIEQYENIRSSPDRAVQHLSSSAFTQFTISVLVMMIAVGGAVINFNLIALPMSEMVGGGSQIGPFQTSRVAALGFILPFALTFVAIPLESFVHSGRTMLGAVTCGLLRFSATLLRIFGSLSLTCGTLLVGLYDLLIFPLLWVEARIGQIRRPAEVPAAGPDQDKPALAVSAVLPASRKRKKEVAE
jgi:hypothetical protein